MSSDSNGKLKLLQRLLPPHGVLTQQWLDKNGIYQQLTQRYVENGWLDRIGYGAFKRHGEAVTWEASLHAVQKQVATPLHIGALTALEIKGSAHYIRMHQHYRCYLFGHQNSPFLPKWFKEQKWDQEFVVIKTNLFPKTCECGYTEEEIKGFNVTVSSKERAAFEMLYLIPKYQSWDEAILVFENLVSLRPKEIQILLEACSSIKVKRLFLFLAEKHNHQWFKKLKINRVDLGKGDRTLFKGGRFDKKYRITLPPNFFATENDFG